MKFNRFSAFTLGVLVTAVSVSAVTYVNAAGDATIKACANKKTGAMRYISKGACKKTERALTWNQMGPQGLPGATGDNGTNGATGSRGKNLRVIDANGQDMGLLLSQSGGGVSVLSADKIWNLYANASNKATGTIGPFGRIYFSDSNCTQEFLTVSFSAASTQMVLNFQDKAWNIKELVPISNQAVVYQSQLFGSSSTCVQISSSQVESLIQQNYRVPVIEEIQPPTYIAPLSIVEK